MGDVSDSELDGLLDDALGEFEKAKQQPATAAAPATTTATAAAPRSAPKALNLDDEFDEERLLEDGIPGMDEFMNQFANSASDDMMKHMEETFQSLTKNPEFAALFNQMNLNMDAVMSGASPAGSSSVPAAKPSAAPAKPAAGSFQESVAGTLNQLRQSKEQSEASASTPAGMDFLKMMEENGGAGMESMMESMMSQLMSKDILYEPMKELSEKYPAYLAANRGKLPEAEYKQYEKQHEITRQIIALYDTDVNGSNVKGVVELMQKMQENGQPPTEILQQLAPGLETSPNGLPKVPGMDILNNPEQCNIM